jgi:hypothetical protein
MKAWQTSPGGDDEARGFHIAYSIGDAIAGGEKNIRGPARRAGVAPNKTAPIARDKSERRNPGLERSPKPEIRRKHRFANGLGFRAWSFGFVPGEPEREREARNNAADRAMVPV